MSKRITIITGQTATGKTRAAFALAKQSNGVLINCDARQIYQEQDIVPGKDIGSENRFHLHRQEDHYQIGYYLCDNIAIWLYDILSSEKLFSAFTYAEIALQLITELLNNNKHVVLVGGTYYYLYHLLYDLPQNPGPDEALRNTLSKKPVPELQQLIKQLSPTRYQELNQSDRLNPQRLIRKIEIIQQTGSEAKLTNQYQLSLETKLNIAIDVTLSGYYYKSKDNLRSAISKRVFARLNEGAVLETQRLIKEGYTGDDPGMKAIGYSQIMAYLTNEISYTEMIEDWVTKEVQYAKRQYTFMKKDPHIRWNAVDI